MGSMVGDVKVLWTCTPTWCSFSCTRTLPSCYVDKIFSCLHLHAVVVLRWQDLLLHLHTVFIRRCCSWGVGCVLGCSFHDLKIFGQGVVLNVHLMFISINMCQLEDRFSRGSRQWLRLKKCVFPLFTEKCRLWSGQRWIHLCDVAVTNMYGDVISKLLHHWSCWNGWPSWWKTTTPTTAEQVKVRRFAAEKL